jgi:hypothetical protein
MSNRQQAKALRKQAPQNPARPRAGFCYHTGEVRPR